MKVNKASRVLELTKENLVGIVRCSAIGSEKAHKVQDLLDSIMKENLLWTFLFTEDEHILRKVSHPYLASKTNNKDHFEVIHRHSVSYLASCRQAADTYLYVIDLCGKKELSDVFTDLFHSSFCGIYVIFLINDSFSAFEEMEIFEI